MILMNGDRTGSDGIIKYVFCHKMMTGYEPSENNEGYVRHEQLVLWDVV